MMSRESEGCRSHGHEVTPSLSAFPADAAGQLDVLGHDGHTLGVDGSQVGVLKKGGNREGTGSIGKLSSLLKGNIRVGTMHNNSACSCISNFKRAATQ